MKTVVCMAEFSLLGFLRARLAHSKTVRVEYGTLPRYLRGLARALRVTESSIPTALGSVCCLPVSRIQHGDSVRGYPALNFEAMEDVVPLTTALEQDLRSSPWVRCSGQLIGSDEAVALSLQVIAHRWLWPQLLHIRTCAAQRRAGEAIEVLLPPTIPLRWMVPIETSIAPVRWKVWPAWWCRLVSIGNAVSVIGRTVVSLFGIALAGAVRKRGRVADGIRLMTELVDPDRLNGTAHDNDFWVDGRQLKANQFALFVSSRQERMFRSWGYHRQDVQAVVSAKGYCVVWCRGLRMPSAGIGRMAMALIHSLRGVVSIGVPESTVFLAAWRGHAELAPLLVPGRTEACLYLKFSYGRSDWRQDSAIVTGLCRLAGIRSAGCQTRVVYGNHYEFAFDCYDVMCRWGNGWYSGLSSALNSVRTWADVGCFTVDRLARPATSDRMTTTPDGPRETVIFTSDVGGEHNTLSYNLGLLHACCELAEEHPNDRFRIKPKEPDHTGTFLAQRDLAALLARLPNIEFVSQARHDYARLMARADRVIALGFTTPGAEGLMLGRPSFYYSELGRAGGVFRSIPGVIVASASELARAYRQADKPSEQSLSLLDPYRDGRARDRILQAVLR